ncbi:putative BTB/POZ domain, BTB/Kelch-associated [Helianthus annuus]|uniref:BTB/POZ domain, BTB/Kelch-associated n=1 Tax=Helianthus annuus TaxID=4232 RepID=A0A251T5E0_HELAN|nr:putative BTB/POZ domain, BTB/Kelch-associated [Helianthus annuus]KAJ0495432.1 putative chromatin remodeling & transcription regulator BTB-POZ family [Helianthus annuus]KAJ0676597.1 putative chromatin remodeling & transcription regulator BTB-POZ family [Helianthus annuus]KAJ0679801.1 putative chromatin remodeling & transcription regulator BTB-POZ family [Helianthus annuus]
MILLYYLCSHCNFVQLFSNGMRESKQCHATLRINASEEAGLMELLKFMYNNNLTVTSAPAVLDVLMVADKYDVASCIRHCRRLLRNLMITTPEIVLLYLGLPSNVLMAEALHPLTVAAKQLYAVHYKDITKFEDEILRLPLAGVEAIIASDDLQVTSEYDVYLFVLKWARSQYPNIENRRKIIMNRLVKFIRYPYMTYDELREFLYTKEFERMFAVLATCEAVAFKENARDPDYIKEIKFHRFVEREAYKYRPVKTRVQ